MHRLVEKYGKPFISELIDMIMINQQVTNDNAYDFLLRHKVITRNTKRIYPYISKGKVTFYDKTKHMNITTDEPVWTIQMNNAVKHVFYERITESDIKQMLEDLKNETN